MCFQPEVMRKKPCFQRRPFHVFEPHLFSDIKACSDFDFQHIFTKIGEKVANSIGYNISKAFFSYIVKQTFLLNLFRGKNYAFKNWPFT